MNRLEEGFLRRSLRPRVDCDIPGRLRMCFSRHALLPEAAKPYLHYVEDVLKLLPCVREVRLNPRIGTILVLYAPEAGSARQILRWVDIVVDTGLELARELEGASDVREDALADRIRGQLLLRLPHTNE
ncbi:MAG: hypothetical protein IJ646_05335 [Clostridia bacterium]|nr:hypothetical protein [Clostridia bacterium]